MIVSIEWIEIKDCYPDPGKPVLAVTRGHTRNFCVRAMWIPQYFKVDEADYAGDSEYNGRLRFKVISKGMLGIGLSTFLLLHEKMVSNKDINKKVPSVFFIIFSINI